MITFAHQKRHNHSGYAQQIKNSLTYERQKYKKSRLCPATRWRKRYCDSYGNDFQNFSVLA